MATGDKYVAINTKRLMGFQDFRERFLDYVLKRLDDMHDNAFGDDGVFGGTPIALSIQGGNAFQLDTDIVGTDNDGHFLETDAELAGRDIGLDFENTGAVVYDVGLHYAERPSGLQINPRTATPEYIAWEETIGQRDEPDEVVDNGATLTFKVDSVCNPFDATKYTFAGRQCLVWPARLDNGVSTAESVVIEQLTVAWDGSNNTITTTGLLGQEAGNVDTRNAWYYVLLLGPTICRNSIKDLTTEPAYEFIGQVTGGAPPTFDITQQNDLGVGYAVALNQITRVDSHGDLKLRTTADASDSDEMQLSVEDDSSATKWSVNEAGTQTMLGRLLGVGGDFLDSLVNAALPRIVVPYYELGAGGQSFTLIGEHTLDGGTQQGFRTYAISDANLTDPMGFAVTINAKWNQGTAKWDPDKTSQPALRAYMNTAGSVTAASEIVVEFNGAGVAFNESAWQEVVRLQMPQDVTGGTPDDLTATLWNALIKITGTTTNGSNPVVTAAHSNTLLAKNMCKAWCTFETDGIGGHTVHTGFNVTGATLSSTRIQIDFASDFSGNKWGGTAVSWASAGTPYAGWCTVETDGADYGRGYIRMYLGTNGLLQDPTAVAFGVYFEAKGQQNT